MAKLMVALLGPLHVTLDGQSVSGFGYDKVRALLAYLAVECQRAHDRPTLAELFWPGEPEAVARKNLRTALATLRQAIGDAHATPPFLIITRDALQFNQASNYVLDVAACADLQTEVDQHMHLDDTLCAACAAKLAQAAELYRGEFGQHLNVSNSVAWEEWTLLLREQLHAQMLDTLTRLMVYHEQRNEDVLARRYAWQALSLEAWYEAAHRCLMRVFARNGQRTRALQQYERCRQVLAAELGVKPTTETMALAEHIRTIESSRTANITLREQDSNGHSFPSHHVAESQSQSPSRLPASPTSLIGRDHDVDLLRTRLLDEQIHLLTLVGTAGIGKTRLGLAVASTLHDAFDDGVYLVELAPLRDHTLVCTAIAQQLGIQEIGDRPLIEILKNHLHDRAILLVLDNFEHVLPAAHVVAELLASCQRLKILVTSRARLRVRVEQQFAVTPLALPDPMHFSDLKRVAHAPAVALFIDRAQAIQPDFALNKDNVATIAAICMRLDGLPLLIELTAPRITLFSLQALLTQLDHRLTILTNGPRDLPSRQQALRNTIDWSYELLDADVQMLFTRLGVFTGGCTLEAAIAICTATNNLRITVVDGIEILLEHSLLQRVEEPSGESRFVMLETIREYALERLARTGSANTFYQHHALFFLRLAEDAAAHQMAMEQTLWMQRLQKDLDNLRTALQWALTHRDIDIAGRLSVTIGWFWTLQGYLSEGIQWLDRVLEHALPSSVRALVLVRSSILLNHQGSGTQARSLINEALLLFEQVGDDKNRAFATGYLGVITLEEGEYGLAQTLFEKAILLARQSGEGWSNAMAFSYLGRVALEQGKHAHGMALCEECLALNRERGERLIIAHTFRNMGDGWLYHGDYVRAAAYYTQSIDIQQSWGSALQRRGMELSLGGLGWAAFACQEYERAISYLQEGLKIAYDMGANRGIARCLECFAALASVGGDAEQAARLFGTAEAVRVRVKAPLPPAARPLYESRVAIVRSQLDQTTFMRAWIEGQSMSLQRAITEALAVGKEMQMG